MSVPEKTVIHMPVKTVIRKGVFETNSSSMHSITIGDKNGVLEHVPLDPDNITLTIDCSIDFGWGIEDYSDAISKMAYCVLDELDPQIFEKVVKKQTGAKVIKYIGDGTIDHQSYGTIEENVDINSEEEIRNFIFNPQSELSTDNDNH